VTVFRAGKAGIGHCRNQRAGKVRRLGMV
jgi:hypothetical protein